MQNMIRNEGWNNIIDNVQYLVNTITSGTFAGLALIAFVRANKQ